MNIATDDGGVTEIVVALCLLSALRDNLTTRAEVIKGNHSTPLPQVASVA